MSATKTSTSKSSTSTSSAKTSTSSAKTGTYTPSTSSTATPGTKSAANAALQTSLNKVGANLKVDSMYGPATAAAVAKYGSLLGGGGGDTTNPVESSTRKRNEISNINMDITGLQNAYAAELAQIQAQQAALAERRTAEVANIKSEFDIAKQAQEASQEKDYAARATGLVTSGGGFLGATQSQQGVLQNLKSTFETEKTALMAKREAAILAAQTAYEDKDFQLAREQTKLATDLQKEIYGRQKDYADQALQIAQNTRAQQEFDMGITDKKIKGYAAMSDIEFAKVNPKDIAELDKQYYPGYTVATRKAEQETNELKKKQAIANIAADTPVGKTFTIGDTVYAGTKAPTGASLGDPIGPAIAIQLGAPNIANMSRKQIIESLTYSVAPQWYKDLVKSQDPSGWDKMKNDPATINQFWNQYRNNPDFTAFKNTVDINKAESGSTNPLTKIIQNALSNPSSTTTTTTTTTPPLPSNSTPTSYYDKYYK